MDCRSLEELQSLVEEFCEARKWDPFHTAKDLAIGVVTEASELLSLFRFKNDKECTEMFYDEGKIQDIEDELADVFFFILRFSKKYNVDISKALVKKIEKNGVKYPINKCKGSNKKYNELD